MVPGSPQDRKPSDHCHPREVLELLFAGVRTFKLLATTAAKKLAEQQVQEMGEVEVMLDVIFIAATALFFTVGVFYVRGCERLK